MNEHIERMVKEFESVAKCPIYGCDSNGTIAERVAEDEWERTQCQYCFEVLFPMKEKFRTALATYGDMRFNAGLERAKEVYNTHQEGEENYCDTGEDMEWACRSDCVRLGNAAIENEKIADKQTEI